MPDISIFIPSLKGGGAERVMVTLANSIVSRGFSVDMVLTKAEGPYLEDLSSDVRLIDLKASRTIKSLMSLSSYLYSEKPIALLSSMGHSNVVALLARKFAKVSTRVVVSERGFISGEFAISKGMASRVTFWLIPLLYRHAYGICAVSEVAAKDVADFILLPHSRVKFIYNPFDLDRIKHLSAEKFNHPWFLSGQPPVVLAIGRLSEAKDFSLLIRAFSRLRESREARLVILGEGELRGELEALLAELGLDDNTVQLPGFVENPYKWLSRCDLFVLSSRREGLPSVLIEAMACGCPVVSTDCLSGPTEILQAGRWGRLAPVGDVDKLTDAMAATLDTPISARPNVRQRASDFEKERAVDEYLKILGFSTYSKVNGLDNKNL